MFFLGPTRPSEGSKRIGLKKSSNLGERIRERDCALPEGIYANDSSLFEMASQNLSSLFRSFFPCVSSPLINQTREPNPGEGVAAVGGAYLDVPKGILRREHLPVFSLHSVDKNFPLLEVQVALVQEGNLGGAQAVVVREPEDAAVPLVFDDRKKVDLWLASPPRLGEVIRDDVARLIGLFDDWSPANPVRTELATVEPWLT